MRTAVFLDRDGVINRALVREGKPFPPTRLNEVDIPADVPGALASLHGADFMLIVVTNQPDVARGTISLSVVEEINNYLARRLPIDEFRTCYHDSGDGCNCRKPSPGSILAAAREHDIDLSRSYMIGDRWRDIEAGHRAGCSTIFVDHGYNEQQPREPFHRVTSLGEATNHILRESK